MSNDSSGEGFWDFSVRTYRTNGVPDACLSLQNDYGADVNMLLYCCWLGAVLGEFDETLFERTTSFSTTWSDGVVVPLRTTRTWMKHDGCFINSVPTEECMQLREKIKDVEFTAEKIQQLVLQSIVPVDRTRSVSARTALPDVVANLARYSRNVAIDLNNDVHNKLVIIICAAFVDLDADLVRESLIQ